MIVVTDTRNQDAKDRLLREVGDSREPWSVRIEQELTADDLFVARLTHRDLLGHATVEASGYRRAGGYEYMVSVFDPAGELVRGPSPFSYTQHALYWARTWLSELGRR